MKTLALILLLGVVLADETVERTRMVRVCEELNVGRRSLRGRPGGVTVRVYDSKNQLMSGTENVQPNQAITVIVTISLGPDTKKLEIENATGVIRLPNPTMVSNVRFCKEGESSSERGDVIKWTWFMPGLGANTSGSFDFNTRIFYRRVQNNDSKGAMEGIDHNSLTLTLAPGEAQQAPSEHGPGEVPGGHKPRDDETPSTGSTTPTPGTGEDPDQAKKIKEQERKKSEAADAAGAAADKTADAHDSRKEAFKAAKLAEQRQKMADMEDANSEGSWQQEVEKEKREHEEEIKTEIEEFERSKAREEREREERIREEIRDKEEHDRMEMERAMRTTQTPPTRNNAMSGVVQVNQNHQNVDTPEGAAFTSAANRMTSALAAILVSLLVLLM